MTLSTRVSRENQLLSVDSFYSTALQIIAMKDAVQRLNAEYDLNLGEDEITAVARQADAAQRLFQKLFEADIEGVVPALKLEPEK
jgi:hypothetical protein